LSEPNQKTVSAKLRRLPGDLLLALLNAPAILVAIAAVLTLLAIARVNNFAENLTGRMTEAVVAKIDLPSRDVLANLRTLTEDVRALRTTLRDIKEGENPVLRSEIARLRDRLDVLGTKLEAFAKSRTILTDEAIGQLGRSVSDTLIKMKGCVPGAAHSAASASSPHS